MGGKIHHFHLILESFKFSCFSVLQLDLICIKTQIRIHNPSVHKRVWSLSSLATDKSGSDTSRVSTKGEILKLLLSLCPCVAKPSEPTPAHAGREAGGVPNDEETKRGGHGCWTGVISVESNIKMVFVAFKTSLHFFPPVLVSVTFLKISTICASQRLWSLKGSVPILDPVCHLDLQFICGSASSLQSGPLVLSLLSSSECSASFWSPRTFHSQKTRQTHSPLFTSLGFQTR